MIKRLDRLPEGSRIAFGPSHGLPFWMTRGDLSQRPIPWRIGWERFLETLDREKIGYVLVDNETLARRPYLARLAKPGADTSLGWKLIFRDRDDSNRFLMYQRGNTTGG